MKRKILMALVVASAIMIVLVAALLIWQWKESREQLLAVSANGKLRCLVKPEAVESVYLVRRTQTWQRERLRAPDELAGRVLEALATGKRLAPRIPTPAAAQVQGVLLVFKGERELFLEGSDDYWMCTGGTARRFPWQQPRAMMLECPALGKVVDEAFKAAKTWD